MPNIKPWKMRVNSVKKKTNNIYWKFNAVTVIIVLIGGKLKVYKSKPSLLKCLPATTSTNLKNADDILTLK